MRQPTTLASRRGSAAARVQHVYSLDVQELSDRLGVSQQELVDGISRDHDHIALQLMLKRLIATTSKTNDEPTAQDIAKIGDGASDDESTVKVCRGACLLLLAPKDSSVGANNSDRHCEPLARLEDGRAVLEHMLHELFTPKIIDRLVVCLPVVATTTSRCSEHTKLKKLASRMCAVAHVQVDFVKIEENDEVRAIQAAAQHFAGGEPETAERHRHRSDGFLVLRGYRIFDAPTICMMAMVTSSTGSENSDYGVRIRALVNLDVELSSHSAADGEEKDSNESVSAPFAGIFAFVGEATVIFDQLSQKYEFGKQQKRTATLAEYLADAASTKDNAKLAFSIEKVVASDYCSWREVGRQNRTANKSKSKDQRQQTIARHSMSSFHSNDQKTKPNSYSSSYSEQSQQSYEHFEIPRERSPSISHGYHGFRVETKHAEARDPTESAKRQQTIGQSTCESNSLLLSRTVDESDGFYDRSTDDGGYPEEDGDTEEDLKLDAATTVLTEADFSAMMGAKNQAFLFQVGPDEQQQQVQRNPHSSTSTNSMHTNQLNQTKCLEAQDDVVFLAMPDPIDRNEKHHHSAEEDLRSQLRPSSVRLRRFSNLPSDVQEIKMEAVVLQQPTHQSLLHNGLKSSSNAVSVNVVVKKQVPLVGYVILIIALCAISSQGAVQDLLVGVPPLLKVFWRMTGASLAFAPLALASLWQNNWVLPVLTTRKKALFALCGVSYAIYNATFIVALSLTSVGHTYIFTNCHSLLMVLLKLVLGQPLGVLELVGAGVGFSGGIITTMDHHSATATPSHIGGHEASTLGDMIAFAGAFAGVAYLMSAKRVRPTMDVFVFMWTLVTAVAVLVLVVLVLSDHETLGGSHESFLSTDATHGLFGWVHHVGIEVYVVLVGSFAGTMGFVTSLKYFDPLVVSVTMLTEPVVATAIGICIGVDELPGPLTFLGGCAVLTGCALVMLASHKTSARVDVSDALVVPKGAAQRLEQLSIQKRRRHSTFHQQQQRQELKHNVSFRVNYGSFP